MERRPGNIPRHIIQIVSFTAILLFLLVYPFLPGEYDRLAIPFSILVQVSGAFGLFLSVVGCLWLILPGYKFILARISLYTGVFIILILAIVAMFTAGKIAAILIIVPGIYTFIRLRAKLKGLKTTDSGALNFVPFYMISLPVFVLVFQLVFTKTLTKGSRDRAIVNAGELIDRIEDFQSKNGHYPLTLQAMYSDYSPGIAGIEKYYYMPYGESYNISFEQPRFLFDDIGTREWVVYNPRDDHRVFSHSSWFLLLSKEELDRSQGWFDSGQAGKLHWMYFLFD